jgi:hypothetical protein
MAVDTFDKLPPASLLTLNGTSPHQIFHSISTTALPDTYLANLSENDMSVMDQPTVRMVFLVAYVAVLFFCVFGNIMILIVIIGNSYLFFIFSLI